MLFGVFSYSVDINHLIRQLIFGKFAQFNSLMFKHFFGERFSALFQRRQIVAQFKRIRTIDQNSEDFCSKLYTFANCSSRSSNFLCS